MQNRYKPCKYLSEIQAEAVNKHLHDTNFASATIIPSGKGEPLLVTWHHLVGFTYIHVKTDGKTCVYDKRVDVSTDVNPLQITIAEEMLIKELK